MPKLVSNHNLIPDRNQLELPFSIHRRAMRGLQGLTMAEKFLLWVIDDSVGAKPSGQCWISQMNLALIMCTTLSTVKKAFGGLKKKAYVAVISRPERRMGKNSNVFVICRAQIWEDAGVIPVESRLPGEPRLEVEVTGATSTDQNDVSGVTSNSPSIFHEEHGLGGSTKKPMDDGASKEAIRKLEKRRLTGGDLRDEWTVYYLWRYVISQERWGSSEQAELEFYALCEHCAAQEAINNPGAVFTAVVFLNVKVMITETEAEAGRQRMLARRAAHESSQRLPKDPRLAAALRDASDYAAFPEHMPLEALL